MKPINLQLHNILQLNNTLFTDVNMYIKGEVDDGIRLQLRELIRMHVWRRINISIIEECNK